MDPRYWDSDCFVGYLNEEADKIEYCRPVIRACEQGKLTLVTSSLTLTEVIKLQSRTAITPEKAARISIFFESSYIKVRQLDRRTAERARDLIWFENVDVKDAVHLATALISEVAQLDTFDGGLHQKSGELGSPPLRIARPDLPEQLEMAEGV